MTLTVTLHNATWMFMCSLHVLCNSKHFILDGITVVGESCYTLCNSFMDQTHVLDVQ